MDARRTSRLAPLGRVLLLLTGAVAAPGATVLMTSTTDPVLDQLTQATLQAFGHQVDVGPAYFAFTDAVDLSNYTVVLLIPSYDWFDGDMPLSGQGLLLDFVSSGGGLVTAEWTVWLTGAGSFETLADAIPVVPTLAYSFGTEITYTALTDDLTLNAGLPEQFTFRVDDDEGTETLLEPKPEATVFFGSTGAAGGAGVIGWTYGLGRVLSFSTIMGPGELQDPNYSQLVSNALDWAE